MEISPKRTMISNLQRVWNGLENETRKKLIEVFNSAGWKCGIDNWGALYDKMTGGQRLRVIKILRHASLWDSMLGKQNDRN